MNKWIKWISLAVVFVLSIAAVTGVALAQGPVDENDDGVCDECGQAVGDGLMRGRRWDDQDSTSQMGHGRQMNNAPYVDADGDGVCDDFVDQDGDGVCDNHDEFAGQGHRYNQDGAQGWGRRMENCDETCDTFVDEDGDGVCDNLTGGAGNGAQTPRQFGGRSAAGHGRSN